MCIVKKILIILYTITIIILASATFIEHKDGTAFASEYIYGSWWFCTLWGLLALTAILYFIKRHIRKFSLIILHSSFILILIGALVTHLFAIKGIVHLRNGETTNQYMITDGTDNMKIKNLPFYIKLDKFSVDYYNGTSAARDYTSHITIMDGKDIVSGAISMNKIFSYHYVRFYQSSYDDDGHGSYLTINSDPFGILITYTGYFLLFISLVWLIINPKGSFRMLLHSPVMKKGILSALILCGLSSNINAATTLSETSAEKFGKLDILYNNRICPLQTYAIDFTKKIYGSDKYRQYSAEQVLTGWIYWGSEWDNEPIIYIKSSEIRNRLNMPEYISLNKLFNKKMGGYILGPYIQEYYQGNQDKFHKAVMGIDDKIQLIMSLKKGESMKLFPCQTKNGIKWFCPKDRIPASVNKMNTLFINEKSFNNITNKIKIYQERNGGNSLPSDTKIKAELIYNKIPFTSVLFMINLTMGFLSLFYYIHRLTRKQQTGIHTDKTISIISMGILIISFAALTYCECLRWIISGTIPMANGYETMLLMAWIVQLLSILTYRKFHIMITFGFLLSGFFLLVSHIGQMDPEITPIMPVLSSPLLSIHVSIIMMSFALLALTFICGITALILYAMNGYNKKEQIKSLQILSQLFIYPAIVTLGAGIFIGAIWANMSWGEYWSWDPKEVWALITFMTYAIVLHTDSLPILRKPLYYHIFTTIAFLTILMTYFGVNYFLGGMHSYA